MYIFTENDKDLIARAQKFAVGKHNECGCTYDGQPYDVHLAEVVDWAYAYIGLIGREFAAAIITACWLHDTIEDCRCTYNDIKSEFGEFIADIVYDVTNEIGKNRKERALRTYPKTAKNPFAVFVKCCDRAANTCYSKATKSRMFSKYVEEFPTFHYALYGGDFTLLWTKLKEESRPLDD